MKRICHHLRRRVLLLALLLLPATLPATHPLYRYFFLEAQRQRLLQHYDDAYGLLQHCLELEPQAPSALYEMALCRLLLHEEAQAEQLLRQAAEADPANYWYARTLCLRLQQHPDPAAAMAEWEALSRRFPGKAEPLYALIELHTRSRHYDEAIGWLQRLATQTGQSEELLQEQVRLQLEAGRCQEAMQTAARLAESHPSDLRLRVSWGDVCLQCGHSGQALRLYREVLAQEPLQPQARLSMVAYSASQESPEAYALQVDSLLMSSGVPASDKVESLRSYIAHTSGTESTATARADTLRVLPLMERLVQAEPYEAAALELYVQYLYTRQLEHRAEPLLRRLIEVQPSHSTARLALLSQALGRQDNALVEQLCQGGVEASPEVLEFHFYLALCQVVAEQPAQALSAAQAGIARVSKESDSRLVSDLYAIAGDACHSLGLRDSCYAAYDQALSHYADNISVLNNYAYYLCEEGQQLERAEAMSRRTIEAEPTNATYLDTYAWILFRQGRYAEARIYIDQALQHGGDQEPVLLEHGGDICYLSGDRATALQRWQQAWDAGGRSRALARKLKTRKYRKP